MWLFQKEHHSQPRKADASLSWSHFPSPALPLIPSSCRPFSFPPSAIPGGKRPARNSCRVGLPLASGLGQCELLWSSLEPKTVQREVGGMEAGEFSTENPSLLSEGLPAVWQSAGEECPVGMAGSEPPGKDKKIPRNQNVSPTMAGFLSFSFSAEFLVLTSGMTVTLCHLLRTCCICLKLRSNKTLSFCG